MIVPLLPISFERLQAGGESAAGNLGNGNEFPVQEVIETAEHVTGKAIPLKGAE